MKISKNVLRGIALMLVVACMIPILVVQLNSNKPAQAAPDFIRRSGNQLLLNGQPFRFAGTNIYWLGLDESSGTLDYPSAFRVSDALATAKEMGVTVVRAHTLGISTGCSQCIMPSAGVYNEAALVKVDYAIKQAGSLGLRLLIPLTDNYHYYHGGKHNFTDWRGVGEDAFYTDPNVIADFQSYIKHMLNRVNTLTGVAYKDDPTIMGWETGNELISPASWTATIADFIKSQDRNHLVVDGKYWVDRGSLLTPSVDIHSDHLYPMDINRLTSDANDTSKANKVFIVGEYDWNNQQGGPPLTDFLTSVVNNPVAGTFFWFLLSHDDTHGYLAQRDGFGLQYPGPTPDWRNRAQLLRNHAYAIRGQAVPPPGLPDAPSDRPG